MLFCRYHGNGFIQVVLNPSTRMHIYSPIFDHKQVVNARIHDHSFFFVSQILLGRLTNSVYNVVPGEGDHGLYVVDKTQKDEPLVRIGDCCCVKESEREYLPGASYEFGGPGEFHDTWATDLTVTVMTKTDQAVGHHPRIVCLSGYDRPDDAFGTQPSQESMQAVLKRVFALL